MMPTALVTRTNSKKLLTGHNYCEVCRSGNASDLDMRCKTCGGGFHEFCYIQTYGYKGLEDGVPRTNFRCAPCWDKVGDEHCKWCGGHFVLPDGRPNPHRNRTNMEGNQLIDKYRNARQKMKTPTH